MPSDLELKMLVVDKLESVVDSTSEKNLIAAKMVDEVEVSGGKVTVKLMFPDERTKNERWDMEDKVHDALEGLDGVEDISVSSATESGPKEVPKAAGGHSHSHDHGGAKGHQAGTSTPGGSKRIEGVGKVIAVASGKGGVGKSTVAVNLALALKKIGHSVGLLDIDVYGPSLPTLLGIQARPAVKNRQIIPLEAQGLRVMSLGFLMEEDTPVIWRGPIVSGIIRQFLQDVDWTGLDYLILDLPPGTGDAQLSLAQSCPLDGAIVVTTPSELALVDAARGLQMFKTLKVDVLGIVENMSYFVAPGTTEKIEIFGSGGGQREAKRLGTEFLGQIPLDIDVRKGGDEGKPVVAAMEDHPATEAFINLAKRVAELEPVGEEGAKKKGLFSFLKS